MGKFLVMVKKNPVSSFYILVFCISWGVFLFAMGGPRAFPAASTEMLRLMPFAVTALLAGPVVSGLVMTGLVHGLAGFRGLLSRLGALRVRLRWYIAAFLIAPLAMLALPLAASLVWPQFMPRIVTAQNTGGILGFALGAGLSSGFFEEIGWTGFAIPELLRRRSLLATGLITGFLWGAWHLIVNFWSSGDASGRLSLDLFLHSFSFSAAILPPFRILMVWVYDRAQSLFLAMVMHLSLTAGNVIFVPAEVTGPTGLVWSLMVAVPLWIAASVLARTREAGRPRRGE